VLDESGQVMMEQKLSTTPKAMREVFGRRKEREEKSDHRHGQKLAVLLHRLWVSGDAYEPLYNSQGRPLAIAA
jgi:hypothetical protein